MRLVERGEGDGGIVEWCCCCAVDADVGPFAVLVA
jgi:hypothetical protein